MPVPACHYGVRRLTPFNSSSTRLEADHMQLSCKEERAIANKHRTQLPRRADGNKNIDYLDLDLSLDPGNFLFRKLLRDLLAQEAGPHARADVQQRDDQQGRGPAL